MDQKRECRYNVELPSYFNQKFETFGDLHIKSGKSAYDVSKFETYMIRGASFVN